MTAEVKFHPHGAMAALNAEIKFHPLAELFPLMQGTEFAALVANIGKHGLREPIILYGCEILDGRNRYRACREAGVAPAFEQWKGDGLPQAFVVSKNLHRRHLNESQRALVAAKLSNLKRGDVSSQGPRDSQISLPRAAGLLNISLGSTKSARACLNLGTKEEISAVERGDISVSTLCKRLRAAVAKKRHKRRERSTALVGKNPERLQRIQLNAELWGRLQNALTNLTNLPSAADVAKIARDQKSRSMFIEARLQRATKWLTEFANVWNGRA